MCFSLESTSEYGVKMYEKRDVSHDLLLYRYHPPRRANLGEMYSFVLSVNLTVSNASLYYDKCKVRIINNAV